MSMESDGGMILTGEIWRTRRKTCPNITFSTTNPTRIEPGANPGLRGDRPATNCLSHGTTHPRPWSISSPPWDPQASDIILALGIIWKRITKCINMLPRWAPVSTWHVWKGRSPSSRVSTVVCVFFSCTSLRDKFSCAQNVASQENELQRLIIFT
jgi:hypothetical protein